MRLHFVNHTGLSPGLRARAASSGLDEHRQAACVNRSN